MRHRAVVARENAYKLHPDAFSAGEIEANEMRGFQLVKEFIDGYGIDTSREWRISAYDGRIWYDE